MNNYNETFTALITGLITGYFSLKLTIHKDKNTYTKEKYENLIFPIFILLEPYLYSKEITPEINNIVKLIYEHFQKNRMYENGRLLEILNNCFTDIDSKQTVSLNNFTRLCSIISVMYDTSCKKLGVSKRTFVYKLNNNQIHPDKITIINQAGKLTGYLAVAVIIFSLMNMMIILISQILKLLGI